MRSPRKLRTGWRALQGALVLPRRMHGVTGVAGMGARGGVGWGADSPIPCPGLPDVPRGWTRDSLAGDGTPQNSSSDGRKLAKASSLLVGKT
jgi:hypothetical protein